MRSTRLLGLLACLASTNAMADSTWPQFRGPSMQGTSSEKNLPVVLDEKQNVVWKTAIHGKAWSSPVVAGGKIWLSTATADGKELSIVRVDAASGKIDLDQVLFTIANPQFCHAFNSYASPTPVVEDGKLYVSFGSPGTACLDAATGKKLWERTDFVCNHFRGSGSSPTSWNDRLFLNFDGSDFQFIVALDKATGKTLWKTDRSVDYQDTDPKTGKPKADGDFRKAFSTARVATFNGRTEVVSIGGKCAYGYDPATGKELWKLAFASAENKDAHTPSATPVIGPDFIYFCTGHGKSELWAVKPGGRGAIAADAIAWKVKKNVPNRSSPIIVDGLVYMTDDNAMASCIDAKTGTELWKQRLNGKSFSASPVFADGRIYFFSEGGVVTTIAPGRELKVLGEGTFSQGFMGGPAIVDGAFYLRTKTDLFRVEMPKH